MHASIIALVAVLAATTIRTAAQSVIDVEGQKTTLPQVQNQGENPSQTQQSAPPSAQGRYSFNRVDNGFLRLDNDTGEVAYCSARTAGWACEAVPVGPAAIEKDVAQLRNEITALKKEIAALKEPAPPRPPADLSPPSDKGGDVTLKLPTHEDIMRAREFIEETWRRFVEAIITMQKGMMRKG